MVEAIKIYTSPEVLERLMSIFIIRINKPSLWTLSPQELSNLYPCTIIVFGWVADDKSDSAAGKVKLCSQFADYPQVDCSRNSNICIQQLICSQCNKMWFPQARQYIVT